MRTAPIAKLKTGLSGYLESVKAGEQVVVTDRGHPVAVIVPIDPNISEDVEEIRAGCEGTCKAWPWADPRGSGIWSGRSRSHT